MRTLQRLKIPTVLAAACLAAMPLYGAPIAMDMVQIGNPGNTADTTGYGAVSDSYWIGQTEVTVNQYVTFLNAVATSPASPSYILELWNSAMANETTGIPSIHRQLVDGSYVYSAFTGTNNHAISYISWFSAARFANWMNSNGVTTETGAYNLNGATSGIFNKQAGATWWIPSEDEWYKAAYYDPTLNSGDGGYYLYPTQSNSTPGTDASGTNDAYYTQGAFFPDAPTDVDAYANSPSYYGTLGMAGNVWEWNDAVITVGENEERGVRGGAWDSNSTSLQSTNRGSLNPSFSGYNDADVGFRLASSIPEPSVLGFVLAAVAALGCATRRRRQPSPAEHPACEM